MTLFLSNGLSPLPPTFLFSLPTNPPLIQHVQPQHPTSPSSEPQCSLDCWWVFCLVLRCIINFWRKQIGGRVTGELDWISWRRITCRCFRREQKRSHGDRMYYVNFTNTWRQILRLLNIMEKKKILVCRLYIWCVFNKSCLERRHRVWLCVYTTNLTSWGTKTLSC